MKLLKEVSIEINIDEINKQIFFKYVNDNYMDKDGITIKAELEEGLCQSAARIDEKDYLQNYNDEIIQFFIESYNTDMHNYKESTESGIDYNRETANTNPEITIPYNPENIKIIQGRFSLKEIYEMINGDEEFEPILDLSPDFQRNYVWDRTRKSRLIESILLNIPLPVFYLSRNEEGIYQVVDGVQRLSVINEFFSNGFRLSNLEYLSKECEWKYYNNKNAVSLHPKFIRLLRTFQIDCNIIEPSTPTEVKFDIFKRLNTGGRSLNNQEIRNSVMRREVRDFIRDLADSEVFKAATNNNIKPKRMLDQEMVLRFIGFYLLYEKRDYMDIEYSGNMNAFLDKLVDKLNDNYLFLPFENIKLKFEISMENAFDLFNTYAFRKISTRYRSQERNLINKSLFTAMSVLLTKFDRERVKKIGLLNDDFAQLLKKQEYLNESITYGTSDKLRIDTTFMFLENFFNEKLGDTE